MDREADERINVLIVPLTTTYPTAEEILADPLSLNKYLGTFTHSVKSLDFCAVSMLMKAS